VRNPVLYVRGRLYVLSRATGRLSRDPTGEDQRQAAAEQAKARARAAAIAERQQCLRDLEAKLPDNPHIAAIWAINFCR